MKVGVVGVGALGGYYGGLLCSAGAEVHLLLRSDYDVVRGNGIRIESDGESITVRPHCHHQPESIGECDLVLVCLKTTANDRYQELIGPLMGPDTAIACLQNGLGNCEQLATLFNPEQILAGLCFVCLNRTAPGVVAHQGFGKIVLGEFGRTALPRTQAIADLFQKAKVPCEVVDRLDEGLWGKLMWNIPFNGLGVAASAGWDGLQSGTLPEDLGSPWPTDQLLADPRWEGEVRALMQEIIVAAAAQKIVLPPELADRMVTNTRAMGAYRASTVIDFEFGRPMELEGLFLEPLRRAQSAGAAMPRLEALCVVLEKLARYLPRA